MTEELNRESCLLSNGSGLEEPRALSVEEAFSATVRLDTQAMEAFEAVQGVSAPPIYRTYQARAATPARRTKADINKVLLHTPEGGESGTLSVLSGTGAGFDWFLPPSGRLYKCNDYHRYIAWHAGDWPTNQTSIGIEQWDFASRMHTAPEAHYDRLARLCAYLVETLDLAIRHTTDKNSYGFIYHRHVTPGARCDPDACGRSSFNIELLLDLVLDYRRGVRPSPRPPEKAKYWRVQVGAFDREENARRLAKRLEDDGFDAYVMREGFWRVQVGAFESKENAGRLAKRLKDGGYPAYVRYA